MSVDRNKDLRSDVKSLTEQTMPRVQKSTDRASRSIMETGAAYSEPSSIAATTVALQARPSYVAMPMPLTPIQAAWDAMAQAVVNCTTAVRCDASNTVAEQYNNLVKNVPPEAYGVVPIVNHWVGVRTGTEENSSGGLATNADWQSLSSVDHAQKNDSRISYRAPDALLDVFSAMTRTNYMAEAAPDYNTVDIRPLALKARLYDLANSSAPLCSTGVDWTMTTYVTPGKDFPANPHLAGICK